MLLPRLPRGVFILSFMCKMNYFLQSKFIKILALSKKLYQNSSFVLNLSFLTKFIEKYANIYDIKYILCMHIL